MEPITMRRRLLGDVALGVVGAVIQVTVISSVVQDMSNVAKIAGYAAGVGAVLHIAIDERKRRALENMLGHLSPGACWTVERVVSSRGLLGAESDGAPLALANAAPPH